VPKKNHIGKEWGDAAESWVDFVRQGKDYFRDELNTPGMLRLIGNVKRLDVLDLHAEKDTTLEYLLVKAPK
jgi:hypothetical protein